MGYYFFFYNKVTNANALLIIKDYTWNKVAKLLEKLCFYIGRRKNERKREKKNI